MNDDWNLCGSRLFKLVAKYTSLNVSRRMIVVIIEPDFAPGDDPRMLCQPVQFIVVRVGRVLCFVWVNSRRGVNPVMLLSISNRGSKLLDLGPVPDRKHSANARRLCPRQHRVAIRIEIGNIHVRM